MFLIGLIYCCTNVFNTSELLRTINSSKYLDYNNERRLQECKNDNYITVKKSRCSLLKITIIWEITRRCVCALLFLCHLLQINQFGKRNNLVFVSFGKLYRNSCILEIAVFCLRPGFDNKHDEHVGSEIIGQTRRTFALAFILWKRHHRWARSYSVRSRNVKNFIRSFIHVHLFRFVFVSCHLAYLLLLTRIYQNLNKCRLF